MTMLHSVTTTTIRVKLHLLVVMVTTKLARVLGSDYPIDFLFMFMLKNLFLRTVPAVQLTRACGLILVDRKLPTWWVKRLESPQVRMFFVLVSLTDFVTSNIGVLVMKHTIS